ncbi:MULTISPECIES: GNAT family N-acetyltransferase [unclassified Myroides]|uniref:GNAT family N-acetyltransferase n=1 Tax=unclassified Myroides TaxID=2642485 RepID=UPI00310163BF
MIGEYMTSVNSDYRLRLIEEGEAYPFNLLLLADETMDAINQYVDDSDVFILEEGEAQLAVFCLYPIDASTLELKNIAVAESFQGKGLGGLLIQEIVAISKKRGYSRLIVGTADCGIDQIRFYERNGFKKYGVKENFFLDNYAAPIIENGIQLKDMVMLEQLL